MDTQEPKAPRFTRHQIRIVGTLGVVTGLMVMVLGGASTFQTFDSLTGALTNAGKKEMKALQNAQEAVKRVDQALEQAQKEADEKKAQIQKELEEKLKDTADLSVTKEGPESISGTDELAYRITIANAGPQDVEQIRFAEPLFNEKLTFVSASVIDQPDNVSCMSIGNEWVCVLDMENTLPAGESRTMELRYRTHNDDQPPPCDTVFVTGPTTVLNPAGKPIDALVENNEAPTVSTRIDCADLTSDLSVQTSSDPSPVNANETMRTSVTVSNNGPSKASNVKFTHRYTEKLSFIGASIQHCNHDESAREVTCALGDDEERMQGNLEAGESAQIELEFKVSPEARCEFLIAETDLFIESDSVSATIDPLEDNNKAPISTEVACDDAG